MKKTFRKLLITASCIGFAVILTTGCGNKQSAAGSGTNADSLDAAANGTREELGYEYGDHFYSDEPVTYTMYFNDNPAYPITDKWMTDGVFAAIREATNVTLDITIVDNANYNDRVTLAVSSGEAPYIIPKIYSEQPYVNGGGVVAVSDYAKYMPNYSSFITDYSMQADVESIMQADGKYYRLPGLKETCLQDYTFLVRKDIFDAAGYDVTELEKNWTWEDFAGVLKGVKAYMVEQGMCDEDDYIWSDLWCGSTSGYGQGGNLLNLLGASYGFSSGWGIAGNRGIVFDQDTNQYICGSISDDYKAAYSVIQDLVSSRVLDPETWVQDDDTANNKFYRGETAIISTNRAQYTGQEDGIRKQLGEGNYELYRVLVPVGSKRYQAENMRIECGVMISSTARKELSDKDFIKLMRFVDWLWYSDEGLTLTKWGVEGETYTVSNGVYSLLPQYFCAGLSLPRTSDDQIDMRNELGYACGNFMYSGKTSLLTSNFPADLRDFYSRIGQYRTLKPLDPHIALSEDDNEMVNVWGTPLQDTINTWTIRFAMGQADIDDDWDQYVSEVQAQNLQNILDLYNAAYKEQH